LNAAFFTHFRGILSFEDGGGKQQDKVANGGLLRPLSLIHTFAFAHVAAFQSIGKKRPGL